MQQTATTNTTTDQKPGNQASVGKNIADELAHLRTELSRTAQDVRMKSRGASAEVQDTIGALEEEVKRFAAQVQDATEESRRDLQKLGESLKWRFQKLLNQIAVPAK